MHATLAMPLMLFGQRVGRYLSYQYLGQTGLCLQHHAHYTPRLVPWVMQTPVVFAQPTANLLFDNPTLGAL